MLELEKLFILFMIYSILGWIIEVLWVWLLSKKLVNRGFLLGPYCPIYGCSAVAMTLLLDKYRGDILVIFVLAMVVCSIIEYITSYAMEKIFKARWWDYSNRKANINGRVCLSNAVLFGILGVLLVSYINPCVVDIEDKIPAIYENILFAGFLAIFVTDNVVSFNIIGKVKGLAQDIHRDSTIEITAKVKEILRQKGFLTKRLIDAYPNLTMMIKEKREEIILKIKEKVK